MESRSRPRRCASSALLLLAVCGPGVASAADAGCEATRSAVLSVAEGLVAADNAHDLERVLDHYTEDVVFVTPEGELVEGERAVRPRYEELFERFDVDIAMQPEEVEVGGAWAFVRGRNVGELTSRSSGEVQPLRDRFLMILRCRGEAGWKVSRLMWVHERPAPGGSRPAAGPGRRGPPRPGRDTYNPLG